METLQAVDLLSEEEEMDDTEHGVDVDSEEEEMDDTEHGVDVDSEEDDPEYEKADLLKWLLKFGFTQHTADKMCRSIPDKLVALQTPAYWAERHIDYIAAGYPEMDDTEHGKPSGPEGC